MNNKFIFLRHALTKFDPKKPAHKWILGDEGIEQISKICDDEILQNVDLIISSTEKKAIQTAFYIAKKTEKEIVTNPALNELDRGEKVIETTKEYRHYVKAIFSQIHVGGWESTEAALRRIKNEIIKINKENTEKTILIVSHGIILSLYFGYLLTIENTKLFERWEQFKFYSWGIVEENKVTKDIIK